MHAQVYLPRTTSLAHPDRARPCVVFIHGAGYLQNVTDSMTEYEPNLMFHSRLAELGFTPDAMGCPIEATMEVVRLGTTSHGLPVYFDANAAKADAVIVVNRIKSHTSFDREIESGLTKMVAIGLGKAQGA